MRRESFTVDETSTGGQYRFVLQGSMVTEAEWQKSLTVLEASIASGGYVVASASLAPALVFGAPVAGNRWVDDGLSKLMPIVCVSQPASETRATIGFIDGCIGIW